MKLKTLILSLASVLIFASCKTYQTSWYAPKKSFNNEFCFNEVSPDKSTIEKAFYRDKEYELSIIDNVITATEILSPGYPTKSSNDAIKMIHRYFDQSAEGSTILPYRLDISVYKTEHKINKAYLLISCVTLTTINILGFPFIGHKTNLIVKGDIYDLNNKLIKTYNVEGDAKAKSAYYWGYFGGASIRNDGDATLCRVVNSLALKDALENLRSDIYNDLDSLNSISAKN